MLLVMASTNSYRLRLSSSVSLRAHSKRASSAAACTLSKHDLSKHDSSACVHVQRIKFPCCSSCQAWSKPCNINAPTSAVLCNIKLFEESSHARLCLVTCCNLHAMPCTFKNAISSSGARVLSCVVPQTVFESTPCRLCVSMQLSNAAARVRCRIGCSKISVKTFSADGASNQWCMLSLLNMFWPNFASQETQ